MSTANAMQEESKGPDATASCTLLDILKVTMKTAITMEQLSAFPKQLLMSFLAAPDRDAAVVNQEFISGSLLKTLQVVDNVQDKTKYYQQCLRMLIWSFNDEILRHDAVLPLLAAVVDDMDSNITEAMALGLTDPDNMRERLPLDTVPFRYLKRKQIQVHELSKDEELRVAFQALFLFLLRPRIPCKYETMEEFFARYPELKERNATEQERLRNTANWMDLAFYTLQPRNNKTFILNLIPRIVEGRNARYITGSGQTKSTTDRVNLFRSEGNCEKIKRPPRRKKEDMCQVGLGAGNGRLSSEEGETLPRDDQVPSYLDRIAICSRIYGAGNVFSPNKYSIPVSYMGGPWMPYAANFPWVGYNPSAFPGGGVTSANSYEAYGRVNGDMSLHNVEGILPPNQGSLHFNGVAAFTPYQASSPNLAYARSDARDDASGKQNHVLPKPPQSLNHGFPMYPSFALPPAAMVAGRGLDKEPRVAQNDLADRRYAEPLPTGLARMSAVPREGMGNGEMMGVPLSPQHLMPLHDKLDSAEAKEEISKGKRKLEDSYDSSGSQLSKRSSYDLFSAVHEGNGQEFSGISEDSSAGGLHLLFAAVHRIESSQGEL